MSAPEAAPAPDATVQPSQAVPPASDAPPAAPTAKGNDEEPEEKTVRSPYAVHDYVMATWKGRGKFYEAQIEAINADGTFKG